MNNWKYPSTQYVYVILHALEWGCGHYHFLYINFQDNVVIQNTLKSLSSKVSKIYLSVTLAEKVTDSTKPQTNEVYKGDASDWKLVSKMMLNGSLEGASLGKNYGIKSLSNKSIGECD